MELAPGRPIHASASSALVLLAKQLLPLPEAETYLVQVRRKQQEQEKAAATATEYTWEMYEAAFPAGHVAIAKELFQQMQNYVDGRKLPWEPAIRSYWLGFQRPGDYFVIGAGIQKMKPVEFWVKLPADPVVMGLADPYTELESRWDERNRQWSWSIPTLEQVPDITPAAELSEQYQPATGPMPPWSGAAVSDGDRGSATS